MQHRLHHIGPLRDSYQVMGECRCAEAMPEPRRSGAGRKREVKSQRRNALVIALLNHWPLSPVVTEWTAYALRDDHVRNGTPEFAWWVCAFCDVHVTPAAVYGGPFDKGSYFTLAKKGTSHAHDCPYGNAGFAQYGVTAAQPQTHLFKVDLPEKLVPARQPRQVAAPGQNKPTGLATPDIIRRRVGAVAATGAIPNQYTTSLLKTLLDARKEALNKLYKLPKITALPKAEQASAVFAVLKAIPLELYGSATNYSSAFHKTNHVPWAGSFIYHGMADVDFAPDGFVLTSHDRIPGADPTAASLPAHILVRCDIANPVNRMEERMIVTLTAASGAIAGTPRRAVSWSAYGTLVLDDTTATYELTVTQPNHISV
jgi:hypothetical protein